MKSQLHKFLFSSRERFLEAILLARDCPFCSRNNNSPKSKRVQESFPSQNIFSDSKYSLRHRKCGVRGYMHELFVSKPRTSEVRASEGL